VYLYVYIAYVDCTQNMFCKEFNDASLIIYAKSMKDHNYSNRVRGCALELVWFISYVPTYFCMWLSAISIVYQLLSAVYWWGNYLLFETRQKTGSVELNYHIHLVLCMHNSGGKHSLI